MLIHWAQWCKILSGVNTAPNLFADFVKPFKFEIPWWLQLLTKALNHKRTHFCQSLGFSEACRHRALNKAEGERAPRSRPGNKKLRFALRLGMNGKASRATMWAASLFFSNPGAITTSCPDSLFQIKRSLWVHHAILTGLASERWGQLPQ